MTTTFVTWVNTKDVQRIAKGLLDQAAIFICRSIMSYLFNSDIFQLLLEGERARLVGIFTDSREWSFWVPHPLGTRDQGSPSPELLNFTASVIT